MDDQLGMGSRSEYVSEYCTNDLGGICKRKGFEYKYRFRVIPNQITTHGFYEPSLEKKLYLFQINTDFLLRHDDEEEEEESERFMGSEIYRTCMYDSDGETYLKARLSHKLAAYWLPDDAIGSLVSGAFDFAKQCSAKYDHRLVISVAVDLHVCTLQLETESADDAFHRATRLAEGGFHLLANTN